MNKFKKIVALLLSGVVLSTTILLTAGAVNNSSVDQNSVLKDAEYIEGEAIVCMKDQPAGYSLKSGRSADNSFGENIPGFECEELMTIDDVQEEEDYIPMLASSKNIGLPSALSINNVQTDKKTIMLVKSSSMDTQTLIDTLEDNPNVEFAEPNYIYSADSMACDEPYYSDQWYLNNNGSHSYVSGNDINADTIYENVTTGSEDVVVAVIDSGVDYTHEDIKDRMWDQGLDYPALKAMGGGKYGYCAIESYVFDYDAPPIYSSDDPYDDNSHGTHCAGIIAAAWNGKGIAGVSNNVKIMAVKAGDGLSYYSNSGILKGFNYIDAAIDCGVNVKVINNSYGGSYFGASIHYAIEQCGAKGALSVFAAGNSGTNLDVCDVGHLNSPYVVKVAASNSSGVLAEFSDYGSQTVDIAAPGVFILSSVPKDFGTFIPELMPDDATKSLNNFDNSSSVKISDQSGIAEITEAAQGYSGKGLRVSTPTFNFLDYLSGYDDENAYIQSVMNAATADSNIFEALPGILDVTFDNVPKSLDNAYFATKIYGEDAESIVMVLYYDTELRDWEISEDVTMSYVNNDAWAYISSKVPDTADIENHGIKLIFLSKTGEADHHNYIIDDVALGEGTIPYAYYDGTSMACPAAVGVAALLASAGIDDPMEIKARLIGGVQRSEALSDMVVSQGILDAEKAYYNPEAVVNSIQQQGDEIIINGYFFGDDKGAVTMTGANLEPKQWSDNKIVCKAPENAKSGNYEFKVTAADGRTGRKFLMFNGNDSEWKNLSTDNIRLNDSEFEIYNVEFAAANGDLYALMTFTHNETEPFYELYKYSIAENNWQKLLNLDDDVIYVNAFCEIYGRLYILCETENATQLLYYNTKTDSLVTVNEDVQYSGAICGTDYNGKILMVGGYTYDDDYFDDVIDDDFDFIIGDENFECFGYEIDPLDGTVTESEIEFPDFLDNPRIKTAGDKIIYYNIPTMYAESDYNGAYYYDGNEWTQLPLIANLADTLGGGFDFSITEKGVIMSGHVLQTDGNYIDVLEYDAQNNEWITNDNIFSTNDVIFVGGLAYNGQYYAFSKTVGVAGDYEFKSLEVNTIDDPQLPEPQEEPTQPQEKPTNPSGSGNQTTPGTPNDENPKSVNNNSNQTSKPDGKALNTGDAFMQICFAAVLSAATFAVAVACVRKKRKI